MTTPTEKINNLFSLTHSPKQTKVWSELLLEQLILLRHPPYDLSKDTVQTMLNGAINLSTTGPQLIQAWYVMCQVAEDADHDGYQRGYRTARCDAMNTSGY